MCSLKTLFIYLCVKDAKGLIEIAHFIADIYEKNSKPSNMRNFMLCRRFAKNGKLILKAISISYASSILFNVWPGIYEMLTSGESAFPARISTLYVDQPSAFDLTLEMIFNFVVLAIIAMVQIAYDPLIYIIFLNMLLVSSIIIGQIDDFKEALLDPAISLRDTKYRMQAIILMILKYNM